MWQRFTERARKVIFYAQEEAGKLGEIYVSTEHLLLGLVRETNVATHVLDRMRVSVDQIKSEVHSAVGQRASCVAQDLLLTPRAKRVIDLAYDEARQLNNNYIGSEHLLLGLIREGEGLAGRVLGKLGVDIERTRLEVRHLQGGSGATALRPRPVSLTAHSEMPRSRPAQVAIDAAMANALSDGLKHWTPLHLAAEVLAAPKGTAARLLKRLNIDRKQIAIQMESTIAREDQVTETTVDDANAVLVGAHRYAQSLGDRRLCTDHLLFVLASNVMVGLFLAEAGLSSDAIVREALAMRDQEA